MDFRKNDFAGGDRLLNQKFSRAGVDLIRRVALFITFVCAVSVPSACVRTDCATADGFCDVSVLYWLYTGPCDVYSWSTYFGATNGTEVAESIVQSADAGYVMAGKAFQPFGSPINGFINPGTRNFLVIKFSESGRYLWHTFLGESGDRPVSMVAASDGYIISGAAISSFGSPLQAYSGSNDGFVAKIDLNGNLLWHTYFGTAGSEEVGQIISDGAGNYVLGGKSVGNIANAGTVVVSNTNAGTDQVLVMKINANGTPLWQSHFGGTSADTGYRIARYANGYVLAGTSDQAFDASFNNQRNAINGGGTADLMVLGVDFNGNYLWHTFHGGTTTADDASSVGVLADGRILVSGISRDTWSTPVNPHPDPGAQNAMAIFVLDTNGDLKWNTFQGNAGGTGNTMTRAVQRTNKQILFLGTSSGSFGNPVQPFQGVADLVVGALDASTGQLLSHSFYGGAATNDAASPTAFLQTCDNGFIISGASDGNFGNPIEPYAGTGFQGQVIKLAPLEVP